MDGCAGYCRHDVPSCRQNRGASAPRLALFMDIRHDLTVSRSCPARTGEGRVTEPQSLSAVSIVSRRAGRCSDLACGTGYHPTRTAAVRETLKPGQSCLPVAGHLERRAGIMVSLTGP
jgi:hypothetical protein